jgi:predicted house-cleaning noncanonical NTP pyrophosphatase (MazG superfamily)
MKLVRDLIPTIAPHRAYVKGDDLTWLIEEKLQEELNEVLTAETKEQQTEELADLYEVMLKFAQVKGITFDEIVRARHKKNKDKGAFNDNWVLIK